MKLSTASKILAVVLGSAVAVALVVTAVAATPASAAGYLFTRDLTVGSTGTDVMNLQLVLNASPATQVATFGAGSPGMESSYFGALTKAALARFQAAHGVTPASGFFGPITRAFVNSLGTVSTNLPAGCTSATGYSSTTGMPCAGANLPAGCTSTAGYSPVSGVPCNGGSSSNSGALTGGAGDATITETSTDVETTANEGETTKVHGFKVEADGSDIAVTSVKVSFLANGASSSSYRLSHYADTVSIWEGSTKVGSANVDDFQKDGNTYSKTIALSNAVVREGLSNKQTFYVTIDAADNIDSSDFAATWTLTVSNIRFNDATGAIITDGYSETSTFGLTSLALSGDVKVIVSKDSSSPVTQNVTVSDTSSTKNVPLLAFKIRATGSDASFDTLTATSSFTAVSSSVRSDVISELQLKRGSTVLATVDGADLDVLSNIVFDLDDTYTVDADSTDTFTITATVNDSDNFDSGDAFGVSFLSFSPEDSNGDVIVDTGSASGSVQTFVVDVPVVAKVGTPALVLNTHTDGTTSGLEDTYTATIPFTVTAPDNSPVYVPKDTFAYGTAGTNGVVYSVSNSATTTSAVVTYIGSDDLNSITEDNSIRVDAGTTQAFLLTVNLKGNDTTGKVSMTGIWYELSDTAPNGTPAISGLTTLYTPVVNMAK